ncbi:unnamed protein product [Meganyctiphanes norvegica]|uniref:Chitin-binding type-2 domain-containing protein n=1 Tax=Meganyctiphanes norvegica TaxID=48144 RepID=A0AAV2PWK6_MEGNR
MKQLLVLLIAVTIASGARQGDGSPLDYECTADGYYADFYRACQVYYKCEADNKAQLGCKDGQCFNQKVNACMSCDRVDCPYPIRTDWNISPHKG